MYEKKIILLNKRIAEGTYSGLYNNIPVTFDVLDDDIIIIRSNQPLAKNGIIRIFNAVLKNTVAFALDSACLGNRTYFSKQYITYLNDMYSFFNKKIYRHNIGYYNYFYNSIHASTFSFVVNGIFDEKKNINMIEKVFHSVIVNTIPTRPLLFSFFTDFHYSFKYDPVMGKDYEYQNGAYYVPIPHSINSFSYDGNNYFYEKSPLRGKYVGITLKFVPIENKSFNVNSAITNFVITNI